MVEDALARGEAGLGAGRFGDQLALDGQRVAHGSDVQAGAGAELRVVLRPDEITPPAMLERVRVKRERFPIRLELPALLPLPLPPGASKSTYRAHALDLVRLCGR